MEIKGSAVICTREYVKTKFGDDNFKRWRDSLSEDAKDDYSKANLPNNWFPLRTVVEEPTQKICEMLHSGDLQGAWDLGRFSADYGLKGIYRFFVKMGSPQFIVKKAGSILPTYYNPSIMKVDSTDDNSAVVHIIKFDHISSVIEHRIGGWMEQAMEISGGKNVSVDISKSMVKGDDVTEYTIKWN